MGLLEGKKGVVFGPPIVQSVAGFIAEQCHSEGAALGIVHVPIPSSRPLVEWRVQRIARRLDARFMVSCDMRNDEVIDSLFSTIRKEFGTVDFILHSFAYASSDDMQGDLADVSRDGFRTAVEISVYSLIALASRSREILNPVGSLLAATYLGGEKVIPGYGIMGVCKAALEMTVGYLAQELGASGIRVNAFSAGPFASLSGPTHRFIDALTKSYATASPLRRNMTAQDVAKAAVYLLSDLASGITGETLHVDGGYHVMGVQIPETSQQAAE